MAQKGQNQGQLFHVLCFATRGHREQTHKSAECFIGCWGTEAPSTPLIHTELYKIFQTFPVFLRHRDEVPSFTGLFCCQPRVYIAARASGNHDLFLILVCWSWIRRFSQISLWTWSLQIWTHNSWVKIKICLAKPWNVIFKRQYGLWGLRNHVQFSMKTISYFQLQFSLPAWRGLAEKLLAHSVPNVFTGTNG